ncbi:succinylglutamate desuccinylase/aspartoacylase family protein [Enterovibrio sp. ZSDZ35]|uniref:Succinylglutamate desuccinylase/aspartoacylase family protein n=1 Tax=Enterovibrio qingdaonensis TaxID=2899818 RepID=A0ABT5QSG0_9GAMM|nr:succinylglutamate desuccinylase/aspartoacylase family protein [Enterovibrio sp. ZSDZ35]MDD1783633.1 succinylglutamate desuccinylase/aspartoacylase family protein [Enterovibrio sp. ZSDZ35]
MTLHDVPWPTEEEHKQGLVSWLNAMPGPVWLTLPGKDVNRHRVVVTLLHGNEQSGVEAFWHFVQNPPVCAVTVHFCIVNIEASLHGAPFTTRHLEHKPDMNRCFGKTGSDPSYALAAELLARINALKPEAVVDIHNTSGTSPAFAVSINDDEKHQQIASLFTERMLCTSVRLGALMEQTSDASPMVTVECGGVKDHNSVEVAKNGLHHFMSAEDLFFNHTGFWPVERLYHPVRVQLKPDLSLCYHDRFVEESDLTLPPDIDRHNFGWMAADSQIGWLGTKGLDAMTTNDGEGKYPISALFYEQDGELRLKHPAKLFMITTKHAIALSDCLFYMVVD